MGTQTMIWGETGTREGVTPLQLASVGWLFSRYLIHELHDGDCVGADEQVYWLAGAFDAGVVLHPPIVSTYRAYLEPMGRNPSWEPKEYHERDRDVVDNCTALAACPKLPVISATGGTAYTVGYARSLTKPIAIVWPNGHISYENWNLEMS